MTYLQTVNIIIKTEYSYEWDLSKNTQNLIKHGLGFEDARYLFEKPEECLTFLDMRLDYGEARYITLGTLFGRVTVIAHTFRGDVIRIISMRKANEREKKAYQKRLETGR